jgi:tetratricopeptide (TPR) repeat protein
MKKITLAVLFSFLALTPAVLLADTAQDYSDMGQALFQRGLYAKAVGYFQQAVAANPSDWQSYQAMGDAYMKMNADGEALGAYQQSLQINPNNKAVQDQVNSLTASGVQPVAPTQASAPGNPPPSANPPPGNGNMEENQPENETVIVRHRRPFRRPEQVVNYNDNLAPYDHAKIWTSFSIGYTNSRVGDLITSANSWNSDISNSGNYYPNAWTGSALAANDGLNLGFELGFLINPNNGIALGVKYVSIADYDLNVNFNNGPATIASTVYDSDFDQTTLSPYIIPITLDYYLFLPDHDGRFYLSLGVGYYFGDVHVSRNYSSIIQDYAGGDPNYANESDQYTGDLTAGAPGFQVGIGRDFAISRNMALSIFAEGRYAKLTNFMGTITDVNGNSANVGLATESTITGSGNDPGVFVEDTTAIGGGNNNKYTTIDFTGVDVGVALNFGSF